MKLFNKFNHLHWLVWLLLTMVAIIGHLALVDALHHVLLSVALLVFLWWLHEQGASDNLSAVQQVLAAVKALNQGALQTRLPVQEGDFGQLQQGINQIAEMLAQHQAMQESSMQKGLQELQQAQHEKIYMQALLSAMQRGILFENMQRKILYHNQSFIGIWRLPAELPISGQDIQTVIKAAAHKLASPSSCGHWFMSIAEKSTAMLELELQGGRVITQQHYPVHDAEGHILGYLWVYEDVSHERQIATQLIHLAEHDVLTGLYNRRYSRITQ